MWNQEMSENKVDFLNKLFYLTYLKNLENAQNTEYREKIIQTRIVEEVGV